jgi:hypothetical protein
MDDRPTVIERAFALAASGQVNDLDEIKTALRAEGFALAGQLYGPTITRQLAKLIAAAKAKNR